MPCMLDFLPSHQNQILSWKSIIETGSALSAWSCPICEWVDRRQILFILQGYDISFLITNFHMEQMYKHKLVDFIISFMEEIDKEISDLKLSVNTRARICAAEFLQRFWGTWQLGSLWQRSTPNQCDAAVAMTTEWIFTEMTGSTNYDSKYSYS